MFPENREPPATLRFSEDSRVLALDWGAKRVGLAISDPLGLTAQGLPTMSRRNKQQDLNYLRSLVRRHHVSLILLGNPLQMSGAVGTQAERMRELAKELEGKLNLRVRLWDERLTSMEAHRVLHEAGVIPSRRGESVDRMAAVLLLQNFLDSLGNREQGTGNRERNSSPNPESRVPDSGKRNREQPAPASRGGTGNSGTTPGGEE